MSNLVIQIHKNENSVNPPIINFPTGFPQQELQNPQLIGAAKGLFETQGVLVANQLFSQDLIRQLQHAFCDRYQTYFNDRYETQILKVGDRRKMLTLDFQAPFNQPEVYGNLFLMQLMREVLGDGFVLGSFGAVIALPGAEAQHIHRDHPPLFNNPELDLQVPSFAVAVVIPLVNLTPQTGSTRVWKGSHRAKSDRDFTPETSFVPYVPTGSCYLMDYQLLHGGTPNISQQVRPILYLVYYRSWFQEAVNYDNQARITISRTEYEAIPDAYKFLFIRQREFLTFNTSQSTPTATIQSTSKTFKELNATDQAQQLSEVAKMALANYGIDRARLALVNHGDNTVFEVTVPEGDRLCLRVHRADYLSEGAIASELQWLQALTQEKIAVPEPILTPVGDWLTVATLPGLSRTCTLTRWLSGEHLSRRDYQNSWDLESIGRLLGQLHNVATRWSAPENFDRPLWNWQGLLGSGAGYSIDQGAAVWEQTPQPQRDLFEAVSEHIKLVMVELGETPVQFGLIHGDFWLGNLLAAGSNLQVIDFADCGLGYWGYDVARFLGDCSVEANLAVALDKFLTGYTQIRTFPEAQLPHITAFIAAHQVTLAQWRIHRAQDHPDFRATLTDDLRDAAIAIEALLS